MQEAIVKSRIIFPDKKFGTGAIADPKDDRDFIYDDIAMGAPSVDWEKGYDVEKDLKITVPIKNQDGSSSCVGQAWAYYIAIMNALEVGKHIEVSAKAFYSQFHLPGGGAYLRDGGKLAVNWGALTETSVPSYMPGDKAPTESFITDKSWLTPKASEEAETLQAKEYRTIQAKSNMEMFAVAIRDNKGVVGGVYGSNNNTWGTYEPKPPKAGEDLWGHALYFGKYGIDNRGKYIATPNSWGRRGGNMTNYQDGWQKLREDYFTTGNMFNPWTVIDKPNFSTSKETMKIVDKNEKKIVIEAEGAGRKGVIVGGKLRELTKTRDAVGCLYVLANNDLGTFVSSKVFEEMPKGDNF